VVNKESAPLIFALFIPIILVLFILGYHFGYEIVYILLKIPIIYYIIIFPVALGFTVAIIKYMRPD
jgi:hypothetical protein